MANTKNNIDWTPVVGFYFKVSFQEGVQCDVSFSEVSGLDVELEINPDGHIEKIKHSDLTLKRAMQPLPEILSDWIKKCISLECFIATCTVVISLLNENADIVASWSCSKAYPKKWSLSPFNSEENKLVSETLTLTYDVLKREV